MRDVQGLAAQIGDQVEAMTVDVTEVTENDYSLRTGGSVGGALG